MHPVVRREVLSHMGYRKLDFPYSHPSWQDDGSAVTQLDLCFLPADSGRESLPARLVIRSLESMEDVALRPL